MRASASAFGLLPAEGQSLILAGALISIALNAVVFAAIEPLQAWLRARSPMVRNLEHRDDPLAELPMSVDPEQLTGHVVVVGYGRVGRRIVDALIARGIRFVVVEQNRDAVGKLRSGGFAAVSGDASDPAVLVQAHVARAGMLVIATPDSFDVRQMVATARTLNPAIEVVVRTHSDEEARLLESEKVGRIFMGEHELATAMAAHVLARLAPPGVEPGA